MALATLQGGHKPGGSTSLASLASWGRSIRLSAALRTREERLGISDARSVQCHRLQPDPEPPFFAPGNTRHALHQDRHLQLVECAAFVVMLQLCLAWPSLAAPPASGLPDAGALEPIRRKREVVPRSAWPKGANFAAVYCLRPGTFPLHQQRQQGFVVGFKGSKIFCLHYVVMQTVDVPQARPERYLPPPAEVGHDRPWSPEAICAARA